MKFKFRRKEMNINDINILARDIVAYRQKPCLVLYYPDYYTEICEDDLEDVDNIFRECGYREQKIDNIDVLLHTFGGDPSSAYQIARIIREFSDNITFLVPYRLSVQVR